MKHSVLLLLTALALVAGCAPRPDEPAVDLGLVGGHVVDVDSGETLRDRDVWILGDRIAAIVPSGESKIPPGTTTVDARGRFLLPAPQSVLYPGGRPEPSSR